MDFISISGHLYNIADFFIIGCTPLFLLGAGYQGVRAAMRPAAPRSAPPPARSRPRVRAGIRARLGIPALAGAGLILVVALGAANYGGVNAASGTPMWQNMESASYPCHRAGFRAIRIRCGAFHRPAMTVVR